MKKGMLFEAVAVTLLILLSFTMYAMVTTGPGSSGSWTVTGVTSEPEYTLSRYYFMSSSMFVGENGVLYTIDGRNVHALDKNGSVLWSVAIPDYYRITIDDVANNISAVGENDTWMGFDANVKNGMLYMIVTPTSPKQFTAVLLAISPDGKLEWTLPFSSSGSKPSNEECVLGYPRKMTVIDSRIYIDLDTGKAVIATNGTIYFWLSHSVLALDKDGNFKWYHMFDGYSIEKTWFGSDGSLYVQYGRGENDPLVRALYGSGLNNPLGRGDVHIAIILPGGNIEKVPDTIASNYVPEFLGFQEFAGDIVYKIEYVSPFAPDKNVSDIGYLYYDIHDHIEDYLKANGGEWEFPRGLYDLDTARVTAYRMNSSIPLWNYTIPLNKHTVKLNPEKADNILINPGVIDKDNNVTRVEWYRSHDIPRGSGGIGSMLNVKVTEGNGVQYICL